MAQSDTEIANMALSHLGVGKQIAALDTELSEEARACRIFYETARDEMLRQFRWPFATAIVKLGLVETAPTDEWGYSYRYPSDCLMFRRIVSTLRTDDTTSVIPYRLYQDSSGKLIYTDQASASAEYTVRITDVTQFHPDFVIALSLLLASYIAPRMTYGDPFKMGQRSLQLYAMALAHAQANALNEEQNDPTPDAEFIRGRA